MPKSPNPVRQSANRKTFTELGLARLKPPKTGQDLVWDSDAKGLAVLLSPGGAKTYRATFVLHGKPCAVKLGRVGEMSLANAREITRQYRGKAAQSIDPRVTPSDRYADVVDQFIELYARPRQRTWEQTEYYLKRVCAAWLDKPFASISKRDAYIMLERFVRDGHGRKAAVTLAWIKTLWRWAWKKDLIASPVMDAVEIEYEEGVRDRHFTDEEIKSIWRAADQLAPHESAYVKLLVLLAPRKNELSGMRRSEIKLDADGNPAEWVTPHERTKSRKKQSNGKRRVYTTPLPPLAQRIIAAVPKRDDDDLLFEGRAAGVPITVGSKFVRKLARLGAPADFYPHAIRHTVATWLENQGHSEFERGLVLNHSGAGVTAGYSHGYAMDLKRALLAKWGEHVERLVGAEFRPT